MSGDPLARSRVYQPVNQTAFRLPDGRLGLMSDVVSVRDGKFSSIMRYESEVKLIQMALGVEPDGIIGPKTRAAVRAFVAHS